MAGPHTGAGGARLVGTGREDFPAPVTPRALPFGGGPGAGGLLEDAGGRRYLDLHGNSVHRLGYAHPVVTAAIRAQMDELPFAPRRAGDARRYRARGAGSARGLLHGLELVTDRYSKEPACNQAEAVL